MIARIVVLTAVLALGCRQPYVAQPVVVDFGSGGSSLLEVLDAGPGVETECLWVPSGRTARRFESRITSGAPSPAGAYPWACAVERRGQQYCGCTLIAPDRCLSAAHCQVDVGDGVRCDLEDLDSAGQSRGVLQARNHPGWGEATGGSDVSVLVLDAPIDTVPTALLPDHDVRADYPIELTAVGWGATVAGGPTIRLQQFTQIPLVPRAACELYYGRLGADMICAGDPAQGQDTCQGDSGGPLVSPTDAGWAVVGVTSWGAECGKAPGVYTDVWSLRSWVAACAEVP